MKVVLDTFLREINEKTTENDQYPVLTSSKAGIYLQKDYFNKQVASRDNTGYKVIRRGQFTYRAMSDTGEFFPNMLNCTDIGIVSPAYPVFEITRTDIIIPEFLKYYFKSDVFQHSIASFAQGSTRTSIKFRKLKTVTISLPDIKRQTEIVEILDKVSSLIQYRTREIQEMDELIKARFVEMFETEQDGYIELNLEEIADIVSGITKGRKTRSTQLREVPYMAVSNVKDGYIDWTTVKTILATQNEIDQYRLLPNDVLMTEGGDPDKVGRGSIISDPPKDCIHQNHIFRVRLDETKLLPRYFAAFLQSPKAKTYFLRAAKQTTGIASINMKQLRGLPTIVPPLNKQEEYVLLSEQIDKSKSLKKSNYKTNNRLAS